jgi:hypothetical protein
MDRFAVANALREMGRLLEARGREPFRVRAYERGARAVEGVADLGALVDEDRLREVPGIGPVLAAAIAELHRRAGRRGSSGCGRSSPGDPGAEPRPGMTRKRSPPSTRPSACEGLDDLRPRRRPAGSAR